MITDCHRNVAVNVSQRQFYLEGSPVAGKINAAVYMAEKWHAPDGPTGTQSCADSFGSLCAVVHTVTAE